MAAARADVAKYSAPATTFAAISPLTGDVSALKGKTVWYVPFGAAIPYLSATGDAISQALATQGLKVHVCDGKLQPTTVASCLSQAGQQKAAAVVAAYIDYRLVPNSFDSLVAKGIPVLIGGQPADPSVKSSKLAFYDTSPTAAVAQKVLGEAVLADSNGKANVVYIKIADSSQTKAISAVGYDYLKQNCLKCKLTSVEFTTPSLAKLPSLVSSALISHPDTNYVVEALDEGASSVVSALQTAGKTKSVKFFSGGSGLDSMQRVAGGTQAFLAGVGPTFTGWQFADGVLRLLLNQPVVISPGPTRVFDQKTAKQLQLTPTAYDSFDWYGAKSFETSFTSAWSK